MEISCLQFEEMIDRLEKGSGQQVKFYRRSWKPLKIQRSESGFFVCFFLPGGESPRSQAAAEGRRRAHQGGVRLLEPQEEKQQGQLPDPHRQAGEAGRLQHRRPVRGVPTAHREDADQEGSFPKTLHSFSASFSIF